MTVKRRISLLVAGAGLIASLVFSLAVFFELVEQPFEILDAELEAEAQRVVRTVVAGRKNRGKYILTPLQMKFMSIGSRFLSRTPESCFTSPL